MYTHEVYFHPKIIEFACSRTSHGMKQSISGGKGEIWFEKLVQSVRENKLHPVENCYGDTLLDI